MDPEVKNEKVNDNVQTDQPNQDNIIHIGFDFNVDDARETVANQFNNLKTGTCKFAKGVANIVKRESGLIYTMFTTKDFIKEVARDVIRGYEHRKR